MRNPTVDDVVRLTRDVPNLNLHKGDLGVVRSLWFAPREAYEVEFNSMGLRDAARTVLVRDHFEMTDTVSTDAHALLAAEPLATNVAGVW